jgi:Ser/Thr protein kinase RdoA (MazF antagonist)
VPSIPVKGSPDMGGLSALQEVADAFELGAVTRVQVVPEGLMNRNWRVTTVTGARAVKQVLDVDAAAARRQHRATAALARIGLPVPAPVKAGDDTVAVVDGAAYAVLPWVDGVHRRGPALTVAEAAALGELLARLHSALAEVMPPATDRLVVPVTDLATAQAKIDHYLDLLTQRPGRDDFDRLAETQLHQRRRLLDQVAHLRPAEGVPVEPCGYTHGDFQYLNVLWNRGRVSAVLDWDRLDVRPVGPEMSTNLATLKHRVEGA